MSFSEADLRCVFKKFDADDSGEISLQELVNACECFCKDRKAKCGIDFDDVDVKAMAQNIRGADVNRDNKITWEEFKAECLKQ